MGLSDASGDARSDAGFVEYDAGSCPLADGAVYPTGTACARNGAICTARAINRYCLPGTLDTWQCRDNLWLPHNQWSCNPPVPDSGNGDPRDVVRACPEVRPTAGTPCEAFATPERCPYPPLDPGCDAGVSDLATCPGTGQSRWVVDTAVCTRNPCPATLPVDESPCTRADPTLCMYTTTCGDSASLRVTAYCIERSGNVRNWIHRYPDGFCDGGR